MELTPQSPTPLPQLKVSKLIPSINVCVLVNTIEKDIDMGMG